MRKEVKKHRKEIIEEDWRNFYKELEEDFESNNRRFWSKIKTMNGKMSSMNSSVLLDESGKKIIEKEGRKRVWKEYFEKLGQEEEDKKFNDEFKKQIEKEFKKIEVLARKNRDGDDEEIMEDEVISEISEMKKGKASGNDHILAEYLKEGGVGITKSLTVLFNIIWKNEKIPKGWGEGIIIPIFKEGDKEDCGNYRGITLMSLVAKLFGRIINKKILALVEDTKLVEEQGGFRTKRGCTDHLYTLSECIRRKIEGEDVCSFYRY